VIENNEEEWNVNSFPPDVWDIYTSHTKVLYNTWFNTVVYNGAPVYACVYHPTLFSFKKYNKKIKRCGSIYIASCLNNRYVIIIYLSTKKSYIIKKLVYIQSERVITVRMFRCAYGIPRGIAMVAATSFVARTVALAEGEERKCPVAFLWEWGGSKPALPAGHPIVKASFNEEPAKFSKNHYPDGVNSKFMTGDKHTCYATFVGPKGIFEDTEQREIAQCADSITSVLLNYGLREGAHVVDVGAGTGTQICMIPGWR
jgi:hypothetical protein